MSWANDTSFGAANSAPPMKFKGSLRTILAGLGLTWGAAPKSVTIRYIMSDDYAAHAIGADGGRLAKVAPTPRLDRLAGEGRRFTTALVTHSIGPPSRAVILTGKYSHLQRVYKFAGLDQSQPTLPKYRQAHGDQTGFVGKDHLHMNPVGFGDMQARRLVRWFAGESVPDWPDAFYYRHYYSRFDPPARVGIRTANETLIHFEGRDEWEWYDLKIHPTEMNNLGEDPTRADRLRDFKVQLGESRRQAGGTPKDIGNRPRTGNAELDQIAMRREQNQAARGGDA